MATPIEHRTVDGVMAAFEYFDMPNFAVYHMKDQRAYYDGGNKEEGAQRLADWLNMIEQSNTGAVYTLKVYDDGTRNIKSTTPHSASTTFMLSATTPVTKDANGVMIIDRNPGQGGAANNGVMVRLDALEKQNRELQEKLHQEQLRHLEQKFTHQIAGLQQQHQEEEKKDVWTRIGEMLLEKPELLDKTMGKMGDIVGHLVGALTGGNKNFIQDRQPAPVANHLQGTSKTAQPMQPQTESAEQQDSQDEYPVTAEGALINPFLTAEQAQMKAKQRYPIVQQALQNIEASADPEALDDLQMMCVEVLERRIGAVTMTHMLLAVACLDNDDLNKLLNNLSQ